MAENKIELKTIRDLLEMKFLIPSYQRGYRWTEKQVKDLLNDVNEFEPRKIPDSDEETWYCLQPLVVKKIDENDSRLPKDNKTDWYEVIDGQQRLTTIFIILKLIDNENIFPTILYETRPNSGEFLSDINNRKDETNIDFFFMSQSKDEVNNWKGDKNGLVRKLKNDCKVIWYETDDNAYDVFKRLNSGKISLSNAELVKALLLKDDNFNRMNTDALRLKQLEMAGEWDRIEQNLHDDSFWYFINPEPEDARFNSTRIDFLLEMILRCKKIDCDENDYKYDIDKELRLNDYFIFSTYSEQIIKDGWDNIWHDIQKIFRVMKAWYDDRQLYHYVGYLMNLKGAEKMKTLRDLICESEKTKDQFLSGLKMRCRQSIGLTDKSIEVLFEGWEYGKNNNEIHNVLLLFNLATTQNQISEMSRYPFDKHYEAAKKKWSLEHIHAQNEKKASWDEDQFDKIKGYLRSLSAKGVKELNEYLVDRKTSNDIDYNTYKAIISAFMGKDIDVREDGNGNRTFSSEFEKDDSLTNMALLQGDKNAAFNNKLYPEKRAKLAEYENVENESLFVPICTRNVFFKHYSPNSTNPLLWDYQAGKEYVTAIVRVVASYIDLEAIEPKTNDDKYGVKQKGEEK